MNNDIRNKLSVTERGARLILSLVLILGTVTGTGELGGFAIVPLLAIYPGITGLLGHDPLTAFIGRILRRRAGATPITPPAARPT